MVDFEYTHRFICLKLEVLKWNFAFHRIEIFEQKVQLLASQGGMCSVGTTWPQNFRKKTEENLEKFHPEHLV